MIFRSRKNRELPGPETSFRYVRFDYDAVTKMQGISLRWSLVISGHLWLNVSMRIHTDNLTNSDVHKAARTARVTLDRFAGHGSRIRARAFDITLQGESRRHQNGGDGKAATWDQWGVFLSALFGMDDSMTIPRVYADVEEFDYKTASRFATPGEWPEDAHGDHRFQYSGTPFEQGCTKCSALTRWR